MRYSFARFYVFALAVLGAAGWFAAPAQAAAADRVIGNVESGKMNIDVVLAPHNEASLSAMLASLYNPDSSRYAHWLGKGEFDALFAPNSAAIARVSNHLRSSGLTVEPSSYPFIVRASGSSRAVAATFGTKLLTYRNRNGITYFANATAVRMPASLAPVVRGVLGLSNTVRMQPRYKRTLGLSPPPAGCEAPYPTVAQLVAFVNHGTNFASGYGAGPGCNGLTPSQDNSIYAAPHVGARGRGAGVNLAVFELSAYQHSDIETWARYFYGRARVPRLIDVDVDGGPVHPSCPAGDTCPPGAFAGDIEVDADIETQFAVAPDARQTLVYNAPNDYTGQTSLDEYARIASDDAADVISSSWGVCENDISAGYAEAENLIFEQMALQGQSFFSAAGDSGAFGCIEDDGTTIGPGVTNPYTAYGNGTTDCNLARVGTACRELPDISANADQFTPYAEYCTASANTPASSCGFSSTQVPAGWFGIGGTSLSSPLWSAIVADRDSFQGYRTGNANPLLYLLFNRDPSRYFHDIADHGQKADNDGVFPVVTDFDLATGIGTPKMSAIITGFPRQ